MKKILLFILAVVPSLAIAQTPRDLMGLGMSAPLADYITKNMITTDAAGTTTIGALGTPVAAFGYSTGITLNAAAQQIRNSALPAVMTPITALTPNAGDVLTGRLSIMATASPTLAYVELPAATANAGAAFAVYNKGASPLLIVPKGVVAATDSINASAAATPYSCATGKLCDCKNLTTGSYVCVSQ
jgi:hypothetical protein